MAAFTATAIAEHFRDQGKNVLLLLDSLTRLGRAIREIGLTAGEAPVRAGYPCSLFAELPALLERAGPAPGGSITALYTVLSAEEEPDVLAEEVKSLLDGHLVLSRDLAAAGIYPAIDPGKSISRLASCLLTPNEQAHAAVVRRIWSRLNRDRELIAFGGQPDPELQACLACESELTGILRQGQGEHRSLEITAQAMEKLAHRFLTLCKERPGDRESP